MRTFTLFILMALNILTAISLETQMGTGYLVEIFFILVIIAASTTTLIGAWQEKRWSYPTATILFSASLANTIWLYFATKTITGFAFGVLINSAGVVLSILSIKNTSWARILETYGEAETKKPKKKKKRRKR